MRTGAGIPPASGPPARRSPHTASPPHMAEEEDE